MAYTKQNFVDGQVLTATHLNNMETGIANAQKDTYKETSGVGSQQNPIVSGDSLWTQWDSRLAFGMDTAVAPVPFRFAGQLFADGTIIAHNNGTKDKNRWGFHVYEAYAKDNYSRMTMLLDKHTAETNSKPSLEFYYYTGSNHNATSYGNTKIGSDVAFHSFCFDRDKLTAYGEIDSKMPITLARISLSSDLNTAYETVAEADAAYEPEDQYQQNLKCLKYIALKNAENGAMFYDVDRHQVACKVNGQWCSLPVTVIDDPAFDIFAGGGSGEGGSTDVAWANGVIDGNGVVQENTARLYTTDYLPDGATTVTANSGYEFCVIPYSESGSCSAPAPYYDPSQGALVGSAVYYTSVDLSTLSFEGYPKYKLIARRTDKANVDPSEGSNIVVNTSGGSSGSTVWLVGNINGNAEIVSETNRIYTAEVLPSTASRVTANSGYEFAIVPYTDGGKTNAPNPYYKSDGNTFSSGITWYTTMDLTTISLGWGWISDPDSEFTNFRLIARKSDDSDITASEGSNIVIT